jgi:hypothetical protein
MFNIAVHMGTVVRMLIKLLCVSACIDTTCADDQLYYRTQKEDEIEEYLRKKYADESAVARHFGDGGEEMSDEITQQTLLPGVK